MELEGKVAIVTGASLGIGSACALDLAKNGANVAINYRKHDAEARAICDQINAMGRRGLAVRADVANFQDAQDMAGHGCEGIRPYRYSGKQCRREP